MVTLPVSTLVPSVTRETFTIDHVEFRIAAAVGHPGLYILFMEERVAGWNLYSNLCKAGIDDPEVYMMSLETARKKASHLRRILAGTTADNPIHREFCRREILRLM
jgi:hypothetical protein